MITSSQQEKLSRIARDLFPAKKFKIDCVEDTMFLVGRSSLLCEVTGAAVEQLSDAELRLELCRQVAKYNRRHRA